jgi:hypothetical protein
VLHSASASQAATNSVERASVASMQTMHPLRLHHAGLWMTFIFIREQDLQSIRHPSRLSFQSVQVRQRNPSVGSRGWRGGSLSFTDFGGASRLK